jgi:hypothetical protein
MDRFQPSDTPGADQFDVNAPPPNPTADVFAVPPLAGVASDVPYYPRKDEQSSEIGENASPPGISPDEMRKSLTRDETRKSLLTPDEPRESLTPDEPRESLTSDETRKSLLTPDEPVVANDEKSENETAGDRFSRQSSQSQCQFQQLKTGRARARRSRRIRMARGDSVGRTIPSATRTCRCRVSRKSHRG